MPDSSAQPPTNTLNGGLFHATAATTELGCVGAGSGERHDETKKNALLKRPKPHSAPRGGRPEKCTATPRRPLASGVGVTPRTGPVSAHRGGRHVSSDHIRARLAPVLYRPSFVVVVSGQWCTHCDARDNRRRLVAIKTSLARLAKSGELRGSLQHAGEITKWYPTSKKMADEVASCEHGVPFQE